MKPSAAAVRTMSEAAIYNPSGNLLRVRKESIDTKDHVIAALYDKGWTTGEIARHFGDRRQTINNRVNWLKAKRWMTVDGKLLTRYQRDKLIQLEKSFMEVEGV